MFSEHGQPAGGSSAWCCIRLRFRGPTSIRIHDLCSSCGPDRSSVRCAPLVPWAVAAGLRLSGAFILRFFAGFCLIANGAYIAAGSFGRVGDCGVMLRNGSAIWQLWLFGAVTVPTGLWLWNRQARNFGLGSAGRPIGATVAYSSLATCVAMLVVAFVFGGH